MAELRLDEPAKALEDLKKLIDTEKDDFEGLPYRAIARARLGRKQEAQEDLTALKKVYAPDHFKQFIEAVVTAELGGGEPAIEALKAAVAHNPKDADLRYNAARAFALASKPVATRDRAKGRGLAGRALELLREAVQEGDADFGRMDDDPAFDPIREEPGFLEIINAGHPDRRYAAVWSSEINVECEVLVGLDTAEQLQRAGELTARGYRPVAWSVSRMTREKPLAASVWHRPVPSEAKKDELARRQARAAVALVRMGKATEVWEHLRHSPDPRLRSFLVNWLKPLGAGFKDVAGEFARIGPGGHPKPARDPQAMDAVLFDRDTSIRRALILALGTYDDLSESTAAALTDDLLKLYRDDPDAGIHGAAEWTLRQWKVAKLEEVEGGLSALAGPGDRRWYVNKQGQTLAVIDQPTKFQVGSPAADAERTSQSERLRLIDIPRRYAIGTREVTVEQFQRFAKTHERYAPERKMVKVYSPNPEGPWITADWYAATAYCNWLSEQEGIHKDQWCYVPNAHGFFAEGMTIPANALEQPGYRLPTEAEWEYACRAGTETSRYYGMSVDLLSKYAWYQSNGQDKAQPCASLLPNDLGLFDMLGNAQEWCQDRHIPSRLTDRRPSKDISKIDETVTDKPIRMIRGGSFGSSPSETRSASRRANNRPTRPSTAASAWPGR